MALKATLNWHYYRQVTRRREHIAIAIAHRLPDWLKYRVYIDVVAGATTRPPLDCKEVGTVTAMEVLQGWEK